MKKKNQHTRSSEYKLPEDYFKSFEKDLFEHIELEKETPILSSINKSNSFKLPERYFETLDQKIEDRIQEVTKQKNTKTISLVSRSHLLYISGIAAMIAIVFAVTFYETQNPVSLDSLEINAIAEYIEEGNIEFNTEDIAAILDENSLDDELFESDEFSDEELIQYLSEKELDNEMIYTD